MDNDELERVMNFIIQRQEVAAEQQAITAEQMAQAETIINALAKSQLHADEQLESHGERIARFERSYTVIADLLNRHDTQLVALTDGLNKLAQTVERYITARGNGNGGA
jgi:chromosome segregation ATPase